jgi:hypothetical protein
VTSAKGKRRGQGEDSIYWDSAKSRYVGAVSLGFSPSGTRIRTVGLYRDTIAPMLREQPGTVKLKDLTASAVQGALTALASRVSTRTVQIARNVLVRAIRHAERDGLVVWRSDRAGSDTKTPKSRWTLALAGRCAAALREQRTRQAADRLVAVPLWCDHNLVFASTVGTPLDDHNVRRQFRTITEAAGLGSTWVPRELRHTFVSLLSAHGVPVEAIALLAGHNQTATTEAPRSGAGPGVSAAAQPWEARAAHAGPHQRSQINAAHT